MPRWKAWLCRLGMPGSAMPGKLVALSGGVPVWTAVMLPSAMVMRTSRAQPVGSRAVGKKKLGMVPSMQGNPRPRRV